jgi:hypothetical protein
MTIPHRQLSIGLAGLLVLAIVFSASAARSARLPGGDGNASFPQVSDSWSPDGRFVLKNVETPQNPRSPHSIFLTDMRTGERAMLYSYARKADVLWSPGSNALAINDWDANDDAQCIVFVLVPRRAGVDLREEFLKSRQPDHDKKLVANRREYDRNYAHLVRWINAGALLFVIEGHSSSSKRNFRLEYEYRLNDTFEPVRRVIH